MPLLPAIIQRSLLKKTSQFFENNYKKWGSAMTITRKLIPLIHIITSEPNEFLANSLKRD
jgi:hypothetical protein